MGETPHDDLPTVSSCMEKMAILGGTFNPVHWGHLLMAEAALTQSPLERVIWLPDRCPPQKSRSAVVGFTQRWEMVRLAIAERPEFLLLPAPAHPTGISYAIETFLYLQSLYPNSEWYWLVGADAFQSLPKWHRGEELARSCGWLVAPRHFPGVGIGEAKIQPEVLCQGVAQQMKVQGVELRWQLLEMPSVAISSSLIRQYCQQGLDLRYLVPEAVRTYIEAQKLYQTESAD